MSLRRPGHRYCIHHRCVSFSAVLDRLQPNFRLFTHVLLFQHVRIVLRDALPIRFFIHNTEYFLRKNGEVASFGRSISRQFHAQGQESMHVSCQVKTPSAYLRCAANLTLHQELSVSSDEWMEELRRTRITRPSAIRSRLLHKSDHSG